MRYLRKLNFFILFFLSGVLTVSSQVLDLAGEWRFKIDPENIGEEEGWFNRRLNRKITLPGSLQEQGYGFDVDTNTVWTGHIVDRSWYTDPEYAKYREKGNVKVPFWLNPDKHYIGVAWYQRDFSVPESWEGSPLVLTMERLHWESTLFVDGKEIGRSNALLVPHRYVLEGLEKGKHVLTVKVDNSMIIPVGENAHSVSDQTQSNWNGIVGRISLERKPPVYLDDIRIYPDINTRKILVDIDFEDRGNGGPVSLQLQAFDLQGNPVSSSIQKKIPASKGSENHIQLELDRNVKLWSEFTPEVYTLKVCMLLPDGSRDEKSVDFGLREFKPAGLRFEVNGSPVFLRGTLESCVFPLTGYPATDDASWKKIYSVCKEYGLNHVRFHSWCPPESAFRMADRMGIYLQVECGGWTSLGNGNPQDGWFYEEADRILKEYGNHPSFCLMTYGNEPGGNNSEYLRDFVGYLKQKDSRRVYTSSAGWTYARNADYWNNRAPRIQGWGEGLRSVINGKAPSTSYDFWQIIRKDMPTISHEIGQWCAYPDFKEIKKYTGVLKAKNFEIFQETLEKHHMGDLADEFLYASGRLQTLCYKADIEAALRTPGFAGFQLLDLHDFPGQGSALVGVLNAFWESKGYVGGDEYRMFCSRTVPLARFSKMIYGNTEVMKTPLEFAHFGERPLEDAVIYWNVMDGAGKVLAAGEWTRDLPLGNCIWAGNMECDFSSVEGPQALKVSAGIKGTDVRNSWNIWVYPAESTKLERLPYITDKFDDEAVAKLEKGEDVLLCVSRGSLRPEKGGDVKAGFSSIFWNTAWTGKQAPHTLGIYCNPRHPALALFPTEKYSDYQWWEIVSNCEAFVMDDLPADFRPIVHFIDDWYTNRKLGLLFEAQVGRGRLMVCGADFLVKERGVRLARRQFEESILNYMVSEKFRPDQQLTVAQIRSFFK